MQNYLPQSRIKMCVYFSGIDPEMKAKVDIVSLDVDSKKLNSSCFGICVLRR